MNSEEAKKMILSDPEVRKEYDKSDVDFYLDKLEIQVKAWHEQELKELVKDIHDAADAIVPLVETETLSIYRELLHKNINLCLQNRLEEHE